MKTLREPFNALSHLFGAALAIAATVVLLARADAPTATVTFAIYGLGLIVLFTASGLYHALDADRKWLQRLDHAAIFIMIAGSYTPVTILGIQGRLGMGMLIAEWALAAIGVSATFWFGGGPKWLRLTLYLGMGWMAVLAVGRLNHSMGSAGVGWMLTGGLLYTAGTIIYAAKRPRLWPDKFGFHEFWHCFVLAGAGAHFAMMLHLVARG